MLTKGVAESEDVDNFYGKYMIFGRLTSFLMRKMGMLHQKLFRIPMQTGLLSSYL
jgi:hypothetical protein